MASQANEELRAQVRRERKRLGWTQEEMAQRAGLSLRTYQGFESGKSWPQRGNMAEILSTLGISDADDDRTGAGRQWSGDVAVFLDVIGVYLEGLSDEDRAFFIREETRRIFAHMRSRGYRHVSQDEEEAARAAMRTELEVDADDHAQNDTHDRRSSR